MRNVLIVSPRFPPMNAADVHRVRLSLPFYRAYGWNPIVLTCETEAAGGDDLLLESFPKDIEIIRVPMWHEGRCRKLGFGQIDYRSLIPLARAGARLMKQRDIPVVFFSTTAFLSFTLGPYWKRRFGCRLVYDIQDPWYQGRESPYTPENAPGSWRKYKLTQSIARFFEPIVMKAADHLISVSRGYAAMLRERYAFLREDQFTVLPFPASRRDYELAQNGRVAQTIFKRDGKKHWVYAGRGGPDMNAALSGLFRGLASLKAEDPKLAERLRLHFVGTNYAPDDRTFKVVEPIARQFGVEDLVEEQSRRIPYFEVLALYRDSDGVLVIGSDSADYTASKLFNCVLSDRPVLALFHQASLVSRVARDLPCVKLVEFSDDAASEAYHIKVTAGLRWTLETDAHTPCCDEQIGEWLAEPSTRRQCEIFDRVVAA